MSRTARLDDLRNQVRQRADIENHTARFPNSELTSYLNQSWAELYELIISAGDEYYLSSNTITTSAGVDTYSLPADFYKLAGVDIDVGGPQPIPIRKFVFRERNRYLYNDGWSYGRPVSYRLWGSNIRFTPRPSANYSVIVWYYPTQTDMSSDSDTIDGVQGWEEFVVLDAAVKCLAKDSRDASALVAQRETVRQRVLGNMQTRDTSEPDRATDVYATDVLLWNAR